MEILFSLIFIKMQIYLAVKHLLSEARRCW